MNNESPVRDLISVETRCNPFHCPVRDLISVETGYDPSPCPVRDCISVEIGYIPYTSVPLGTQYIETNGTTSYNKA